jgi:hypothetical protein
MKFLTSTGASPAAGQTASSVGHDRVWQARLYPHSRAAVSRHSGLPKWSFVRDALPGGASRAPSTSCRGEVNVLLRGRRVPGRVVVDRLPSDA